MKRMEPRCVVCSWPLRVVSHIVILNLRAPYLSIIFEVKSRFFWCQNWRLSPISIFLDFWYVFYTLYFSRIPQKTFLLQLVWGITIEWLDYLFEREREEGEICSETMKFCWKLVMSSIVFFYSFSDYKKTSLWPYWPLNH